MSSQELGRDLRHCWLCFRRLRGRDGADAFLGDGVRNRFGAVATFRVSSLVAAAGILVAGLAPWPWLAIGAFAISGLGIANMVPILFSAAGNQPDINPGAGMSVVTTMGYSGILVAPSIIGFVGERTGFSPVYIAIAVLLLLVFLAAGMTRAADFSAESHDPVLPSEAGASENRQAG